MGIGVAPIAPAMATTVTDGVDMDAEAMAGTDDGIVKTSPAASLPHL